MLCSAIIDLSNLFNSVHPPHQFRSEMLIMLANLVQYFFQFNILKCQLWSLFLQRKGMRTLGLFWQTRPVSQRFTNVCLFRKKLTPPTTTHICTQRHMIKHRALYMLGTEVAYICLNVCLQYSQNPQKVNWLMERLRQ